MVIKESQVKAIIQEEIQKMLEEGEIDEGVFDFVGKAGKALAGKAAKLGNLTSADLATQEKAAAAEKEKSDFATGVVSGTKRAKEVENIVNQVVKELIKIDKTLESLTEFSQNQEKIQALHASLDAFHRELDSFKKSALGYKFESKIVKKS